MAPSGASFCLSRASQIAEVLCTFGFLAGGGVFEDDAGHFVAVNSCVPLLSFSPFDPSPLLPCTSSPSSSFMPLLSPLSKSSLLPSSSPTPSLLLWTYFLFLLLMMRGVVFLYLTTYTSSTHMAGLLAWNALDHFIFGHACPLIDASAVADERLRVLLRIITRHHDHVSYFRSCICIYILHTLVFSHQKQWLQVHVSSAASGY